MNVLGAIALTLAAWALSAGVVWLLVLGFGEGTIR